MLEKDIAAKLARCYVCSPMNITKLLLAGIVALVTTMASYAEDKLPPCCEKAKAAGKDCDHKCCVKAKADGKTCEKCAKK